MALLTALKVVVDLLPGHAAGVTLDVLLGFVLIRRLHDLGRSGWWVLGLLGTPIGLLFALWGATSLETATLWATLLSTAVLAIGALPGTPQPNRFGPPAPFSWGRFLRGR